MQKTYSPVKFCIYCGSTKQLSDEHIIPISLGGTLTLPESSCEDCQKKTCGFEGIVTQQIYMPLRRKLKIKGNRKHKKHRATHAPIMISDGETQTITSVPFEDLPTSYLAVRFPPPGLFLGHSPHSKNPEMKIDIIGNKKEMEEFASQRQIGRMKTNFTFRWGPFARMLAKIGHAHAVAELGMEGLEFLLPPIIRGESNHLAYFVGGIEGTALTLSPPHDMGLAITTIGSDSYLVALMTFLGHRLPTYQVVVAKILDRDLISRKMAAAPAR